MCFLAVLGFECSGVVLFCSDRWCALLIVLALLVVMWSLRSLLALLAVYFVSSLGILCPGVSGFPRCFLWGAWLVDFVSLVFLPLFVFFCCGCFMMLLLFLFTPLPSRESECFMIYQKKID